MIFDLFSNLTMDLKLASLCFSHPARQGEGGGGEGGWEEWGDKAKHLPRQFYISLNTLPVVTSSPGPASSVTYSLYTDCENRGGLSFTF